MQGKNVTDIFIIFMIWVFSSYHFKYDDNRIKIFFYGFFCTNSWDIKKLDYNIYIKKTKLYYTHTNLPSY